MWGFFWLTCSFVWTFLLSNRFWSSLFLLTDKMNCSYHLALFKRRTIACMFSSGIELQPNVNELKLSQFTSFLTFLITFYANMLNRYGKVMQPYLTTLCTSNHFMFRQPLWQLFFYSDPLFQLDISNVFWNPIFNYFPQFQTLNPV